MLAYPVSEAEEMLGSKLDAARDTLDACEEDLDFLREQITVRFSLFLVPSTTSSSSLPHLRFVVVSFHHGIFFLAFLVDNLRG